MDAILYALPGPRTLQCVGASGPQRGAEVRLSLIGAEGTIAGVGLGLAICRAIVRAHGGTIEAAHRPGGGARLEFTLPVLDAAS